jgi:uncharacterized protein
MHTLENTIITLPSGVDSDCEIAVPDSWLPGTGVGILLAHGMANDLDNPVVREVALGLADRGVLSMRFNFSYRQRNKPKAGSNNELESDYIAAAQWLTEQKAYNPLYMIYGGKSLGARVAAQVVAAGKLEATGMVYLGYPLHAPGRKDKLRDGPILEVPARQFFIEGDRDPFCDLTLLEQVLDEVVPVPGLFVVEGGEHSFKLPKKDPRSYETVLAEVTAILASWIIGPIGIG